MLAVLISPPTTPSQPSGGAQFEGVSIKPNKSEPGAGGGISTLPDRTFMMTNHPIESIIRAASPVPVREVSGLPNWAKADSYDIIAKPPAGSTAKQRAEMMRNLFIERMKLAGHVEERERTTL